MIGSKVPLSEPHTCIKIFDLAVHLCMMLYFCAYLCLIFKVDLEKDLPSILGAGFSHRSWKLKNLITIIKERQRHDGDTGTFLYKSTTKSKTKTKIKLYVCMYIYITSKN